MRPGHRYSVWEKVSAGLESTILRRLKSIIIFLGDVFQYMISSIMLCQEKRKVQQTLCADFNFFLKTLYGVECQSFLPESFSPNSERSLGVLPGNKNFRRRRRRFSTESFSRAENNISGRFSAVLRERPFLQAATNRIRRS